jgi:hypothetical protein
MMATAEVATQEILSREQIDTPIGFREALEEASRAGLSAEQVNVVLNPYTTLNKDKSPLLNVPFIIRAVKFQEEKNPDGSVSEYVNIWCITEDDKLYRVTDGSTGIFTQIKRLVEKRIEEGHPTPYNYFAIVNGLRVSKFGVTADGTAVPLGDSRQKSEAETFYLA